MAWQKKKNFYWSDITWHTGHANIKFLSNKQFSIVSNSDLRNPTHNPNLR